MTRALVLLSLLAACSGLSHRLHPDVPRPATIAVLPVGGDAAPALRELARGLLQARLQEHGFLVADADVVDQRLAERGWLADPDAFAPSRVKAEDAASAIGVEAVLLVADCDESRWNAVLVRRHSLAAHARIVLRDGREWWTAADTVGETGGLLLKSGQVLTEIGAQGVHGAGSASVDRIDELVTALASTLPVATMEASMAEAPTVPAVRRAEVVRTADGERRLVVEADLASPTAVSVFDVGDVIVGVPMAGPMVGNGVRAGAVDLPPGMTAAEVRVRSRAALGPASASAPRSASEVQQ